MAQMYRKESSNDTRQSDESTKEENEKRSHGAFKFNLAAPEFVPTTAQTSAQFPIAGYFYPYFQYMDGNTGSWVYLATGADQEAAIPLVEEKANGKLRSDSTDRNHTSQKQQQQLAKEAHVSDGINNKIIKQAEYMFSDISMLANETLVKHANKDPQGFVPINFVTTLKKLKSLNINNQLAAHALKFSEKLVVSDDCKKVRRKKPFTEKEKEDLQLRTVIAENLPSDHSHQKIEKIFNAVGSIRSIRICQPQEHNLRSSKGDVVVSNKLHALVEYDSPESAEKAAEKLNDERNWRKGMRVRVMLKRSPRSVLKSQKSEFDICLVEEGAMHHAPEDASRVSNSEAEGDGNASATKNIWARNRAKPKLRPQLQTSHSLPTPTSHAATSCPGQAVKGPRMPDGTRGFTMGRGKVVAVPSRSTPNKKDV